MSVFKIMIGTGFLLLLISLVFIFSDVHILGPTKVDLIGLNVSEIVLGEGDICSSYGHSPKCKSGLICEVNIDFPDADGRCIKPNVTSVYNIRN